jgi:hypothetical protein
MWCGLEFSKHLKYLGSVLFINSYPRVCDFDLQLKLPRAIIDATRMHCYRPVESEFEGVANQVDEYLLHSLDVDDQVFRDWVVKEEWEVYVFLVGLDLENFYQLIQMFSDVYLSFIFWKFAIS